MEFTLECLFTIKDTRAEISILLPSDMKDQFEGSKWDITEQGKTGWILARHQIIMDRTQESYEVGSAFIYEIAKELAISRSTKCTDEFLKTFERVYEQRRTETMLAVRYDIWELLGFKKEYKQEKEIPNGKRSDDSNQREQEGVREPVSSGTGFTKGLS
jgi:hypothetical protein